MIPTATTNDNDNTQPRTINADFGLATCNPREGAARTPGGLAPDDGGAANGTGQDGIRRDTHKAKSAARRGRGRVRVATLNMNGFGRTLADGSTDKWLGINQVMKDHRLAILAVQETHLMEDRVQSLNRLFESQLLIVATFDESSPTAVGGTAFVLSRRFLREQEPRWDVLWPGRALAVTVPWTAEKTLTLLSVYAPNDPAKNASFWCALQEHYGNDARRRRPDFLLGDFNIVEQADDRLPQRSDNGEAVGQLQKFLSSIRVSDAWRRTNEGVRIFSYLQVATGSQSRIDRIYVSARLLSAVADWEHTPPGFPTDHSIVVCSVANYKAPVLGRGRWSLPLHLLEDPEFVATMKAIGIKTQNELTGICMRTDVVNPQTVFHSFKAELVKAARTRMK
ncbi:Endonuclease/exonuclease/phosphatase, partial [Lenzites betulinus]